MKKAHWNAVVHALLLVMILVVMFIGILLGFFIARAGGPQAEKYLWGLHRHDWGDLHLYFSLTLVGLVILHFILHMSWIRSMSKQCLGLPWVMTLLILLLVAAGIVTASAAIKRAYPGAYEQEGRGFGPGGGRGRQYQQEELRPGNGTGQRRGGGGRAKSQNSFEGTRRRLFSFDKAETSWAMYSHSGDRFATEAFNFQGQR